MPMGTPGGRPLAYRATSGGCLAAWEGDFETSVAPLWSDCLAPFCKGAHPFGDGTTPCHRPIDQSTRQVTVAGPNVTFLSQPSLVPLSLSYGNLCSHTWGITGGDSGTTHPSVNHDVNSTYHRLDRRRPSPSPCSLPRRDIFVPKQISSLVSYAQTGRPPDIGGSRSHTRMIDNVADMPRRPEGRWAPRSNSPDLTRGNLPREIEHFYPHTLLKSKPLDHTGMTALIFPIVRGKDARGHIPAEPKAGAPNIHIHMVKSEGHLTSVKNDDKDGNHNSIPFPRREGRRSVTERLGPADAEAQTPVDRKISGCGLPYDDALNLKKPHVLALDINNPTSDTGTMHDDSDVNIHRPDRMRRTHIKCTPTGQYENALSLKIPHVMAMGTNNPAPSMGTKSDDADLNITRPYQMSSALIKRAP